MLKRNFPLSAWLFFIAGSVLQITWYGLMWINVLSQPDVLKAVDFSIFYTAGRIAASGHYDLLYDVQTQVQVQGELLGKPIQTSELLPFNHLLLLVPIQQLISTPNYTASYLRWNLVMVGFLAVTAVVINRLFLAVEWERSPRMIVVISSLLFYPAFVSLLKGQDTTFLMLGVGLWVYGVINKMDIPAGIGLAIAAIRPQIALMLGVPFLFNRQKVLGWAVLAGVVHLASFLLLGLEGATRFAEMLLISARGEGFYLNRSAMFNLAGALVRLFPEMDNVMILVMAWSAFLLTLFFLCLLWARSQEIEFRHLSLALLLSLFTAPHLHYHDLALLLFPILCLMLAGVRTGWISVARSTMILMLASFLLLLSHPWDPTRYFIPYLVMFLLAGGTWLMEKSPRNSSVARAAARR